MENKESYIDGLIKEHNQSFDDSFVDFILFGETMIHVDKNGNERCIRVNTKENNEILVKFKENEETT